ncbi:CcdB family protein [Parvularcula dongshanensis]|uniref:Toxin CcdB n=1 Tax=Parvularcula dongshanensis TaxID=1173995 RepID=A0A840I3V7_9PROT|nr:CcdB family protein [Parvularcula dongshanensis]MBB4659015.1 toxin CcdB [Parvularcula dongshanensis]
MARFDVHRLKGAPDLLVVNVQAEFLDHLGSRVVVPLAPLGSVRQEVFSTLKPEIEVGGEPYILSTPDLGAALLSEFGEYVANVEARYRDDITRALDVLLTGF